MSNDNNLTTCESAIESGKRLKYNDIAKSVGMLLIMWGHIRLRDWSNAFVYAFHIPLFFTLSGMVFNKSKYDSFGSFLKKKFASLLLPYFIFSVLTWIVWAGFAYLSHQKVDSFWMPLAETLIARGSGGYLVHNVPLWFVSCLFIMEVIYYFMADLNRVMISVLTIAMAVVSYYAIKCCIVIDFTAIPWNIETAMLGIPFFAAGHWAVQLWGHQNMISWVNERKAISWTSVIVMAAIVFIGSAYNGSISFGHDDLGKNALLAYACAFVGVAMILIFCMLVGNIQFKGICAKIMYLNIWFGRNSFTAMAIHNPIKGIMCVVVGGALHCGSSAVSHSSLYSLPAFIGTLFVSMFGIWVVNWIKGLKEKNK